MRSIAYARQSCAISLFQSIIQDIRNGMFYFPKETGQIRRNKDGTKRNSSLLRLVRVIQLFQSGDQKQHWYGNVGAAVALLNFTKNNRRIERPFAGNELGRIGYR